MKQPPIWTQFQPRPEFQGSADLVASCLVAAIMRHPSLLRSMRGDLMRIDVTPDPLRDWLTERRAVRVTPETLKRRALAAGFGNHLQRLQARTQFFRWLAYDAEGVAARLALLVEAYDARGWSVGPLFEAFAAIDDAKENQAQDGPPPASGARHTAADDVNSPGCLGRQHGLDEKDD